MKDWLLASDFDGTLATRGVFDAPAEAAVRRWRAAGGKFVIVTGRILTELMPLVPHPDILDGVVAEDGAVMWLPHTGARPLAEAPPVALLESLRRRGVPFVAGQAVVFTVKPHERAVLNAIRDLGLEHHIVFNWDAVMVLPPGVNKAFGTKAAAQALGIPMKRVAAIGDGENDHSLLLAAGESAAVGNAVPSLKSVARRVTLGQRGAGVVEFVEALAAGTVEPPSRV